MIHRGVLGRTDRGISRSGKYNAPDAVIILINIQLHVCMELYVADNSKGIAAIDSRFVEVYEVISRLIQPTK